MDITNRPIRTRSRVEFAGVEIYGLVQKGVVMVRAVSLLIAAGVVLSFASAYSQDANNIVARKNVELVSAPPNGLLCRSGSVVATIPAGAIVQKLGDVTALCGPFISQMYMRVFYQNAGAPIAGYVRATDDNGNAQFAVAK